jgi:hypothetical protein
VLVAHLGFILFALLGGLLALRWARAALLHLPAVAWGAWIELSHGICPLTPLEQALRGASGSGGYTGGFIEHYLVPLIYPAALSSRTQFALGLGLLLVNAAIYGLVIGRRLSPRRG